MKNFLKSKTFWINLILGIASVLGKLPGDSNQQMLAASAMNIGLRFISKDKVTLLPFRQDDVN